jgi:hypothetical protein
MASVRTSEARPCGDTASARFPASPSQFPAQLNVAAFHPANRSTSAPLRVSPQRISSACRHTTYAPGSPVKTRSVGRCRSRPAPAVPLRWWSRCVRWLLRGGTPRWGCERQATGEFPAPVGVQGGCGGPIVAGCSWSWLAPAASQIRSRAGRPGRCPVAHALRA